MTVTTTRHDTVTVLNLGDDENRFSPDWLDCVAAALDENEAREPTALVTVANGKFYSNGLDLQWLSANGEKAQWYVDRVHGLFARVLTLPVPTIAAINGHAFGAGAMLALAHDFRVMRTDRGFFCLPEVDIRIPFTPGMAALVQAKTTPRTATAAMTTGRRFGGPDALAAGIVDATAEESALVTSAVGTVAPLVGKDPGTLGAIKSTMYATTIAALTTPQS